MKDRRHFIPSRAIRLQYAMGGLACCALLLAGSPVWSADELDEAMDVRATGNKSSVESQTRIDRTADQTDTLRAEYRTTLEQIEALRIYNRQLEILIEAQDVEIASIEEQIDNVTIVGRQVTPLMLKMVNALSEFVDLDVPFLPNERQNRIARLRELMGRADVTDSEKFRQVMEAYQIENDYGRTLGTYTGDLEFAGVTKKVNFLRLGRVALVYQTPDGVELGAWDQSSGQWVPLPRNYQQSIRKGIRIALKQAAPDLIRLPVPAPEAR